MSLSVQVFDNVGDASSRLAKDIARDLREKPETLLSPRFIVTPHTHFATWLNLRLAKECGVIANIHMTDIDRALAQALTPDPIDTPPPMLHPSDIAPLIFAILINPESKHNVSLSTFMEYIGDEKQEDRFLKAWQLSSRLSYLFLEYSYQRPNMIREWLENRCIPLEWEDMPQSAELRENVERIQRAEQKLYKRLFGDGAGLRTYMPIHRTLPELANEWIDSVPDSRPPLYFVCTPIMSIWHMRTIRAIADRRDVRLYFAAPRGLAEDDATSPVQRIILDWGKSQRRAFFFYREIMEFNDGTAHPIGKSDTVLYRFQELLKGRSLANQHRIKQDSSLDIWSCPGIMREVESVYERILDLVAQDESLQLTDIAVLTPDMERYQAPLRIVFSQHPNNIPYNIVDANVAQSSLYAQGVEELMNLLNSSFPRDKVFRLFRNPCFQAAFDIDNEMVDQWLAWANTLGIYHDLISPKRKGGEEETTLPEPMTWEFALQRLRLGAIMSSYNTPPADGVSPHYQNRIPYSDMPSQDQDTLSKLSKIIALFRKFRIHEGDSEEEMEEENGYSDATIDERNKRSLADWAEMLRSICDTFLKVPFDHPVEEVIRKAVYATMDKMAGMSSVFADCHNEKVPFFVPQTLLRESLVNLPARYGRAVTGGVTIASLRRGRLIPFRHIFILGLGEGQFPGDPDRSSIDMRHWTRENAEYDLDIPEFNKGCFLDIILSAKEGLHLSYVGLSPEDKKEWNPCSLLNQIINLLNDHVISPPFRIQTIPLTYRSQEYLRKKPMGALSPLPNRNKDQLLLLAKDVLLHREKFPSSIVEEASRLSKAAEEKWRELHAAPRNMLDDETEIHSISLRHLSDFLRNPLIATIRHVFGIELYAEDKFEWENESEEPFASDAHAVRWYQYDLIDNALYHGEGFQMDQRFHQLYQDRWLRCRTPIDAFRNIDERGVLKQLHSELDKLTAKLVKIDANSLYHIVMGERDQTRATPTKQISLAPLDIALSNSRPIRIHGLINNILQDSESITLIIPSVNSLSQSNLPREALGPLLSYLALASLEGTQNAWIKHRRFVIRFLTPQSDFEIPCQCDPNTARSYLERLADDACVSAREDYLPFEIHSKIKISEKLEESEKERFFMEEYLYQLDNADNGFPSRSESSRNSSILDIIRSAPPADAYEKVQRRFDLLRNLYRIGGEQ